MKAFRGDIWSLSASHFVIVPCNVGWTIAGIGVFGKGLALQAAQRFPKLPVWYGFQCQKFRENTPVLVYPDAALVMFPTKPLNMKCPWHSWKGPSTLAFVEKGLAQLVQLQFARPVAVPLLGCGAGGLREQDVVELIGRYLKDDLFTLVYPGQPSNG